MIGGGEGDVIGERKVRVGGAAEVGDIIQKAPNGAGLYGGDEVGDISGAGESEEEGDNLAALGKPPEGWRTRVVDVLANAVVDVRAIATDEEAEDEEEEEEEEIVRGGGRNEWTT